MKKLHTQILLATLIGLTLLTAEALRGACVRDASFVQVDPGFNSANTILVMTPQADGKVLVGGSFTYTGPMGVNYNNFVRFNANGSFDTSFIPNVNGAVYSALVQPDGKILIAGTFTQVGGMARSFVARLLANGSVDYQTFSPPAPNFYVLALARQPQDGKILIGGGFSTVGTFSSPGIARLNTDGSIDPSFVAAVGNGSRVVYSIAQYPPSAPSSTKIVIGGSFTQVGNLSRVNIARLNSNGMVDSTFDTGPGNVLNGTVYAVATDYGPFTIAGGAGANVEKVLIGGAFTGFAVGARNYFTRLSATGFPDYNIENSYPNGVVKSIQVQSLDHKILLGGSFTQYQGSIRNGILRLNTPTDLIQLDSAWDDCGTLSGATGGNGKVESVGVANSGSIYIGGGFGLVDGVSQSKIARLVP